MVSKLSKTRLRGYKPRFPFDSFFFDQMDSSDQRSLPFAANLETSIWSRRSKRGALFVVAGMKAFLLFLVKKSFMKSSSVTGSATVLIGGGEEIVTLDSSAGGILGHEGGLSLVGLENAGKTMELVLFVLFLKWGRRCCLRFFHC